MIAPQDKSSDEDNEYPAPAAKPPQIALRFKEYSDVVTIPYTYTENFYQLSMCCWIKCEWDYSKTNDPCYILAKKGSFALGLRSDEIAVAFHNKRPGWLWIGGRWRVPLHTWTHITVTYDAMYESANVYANGNLVCTQGVQGKLKGSSQPLLVAVELRPDKGTRTRFRGLVSQVTLWETVIDPETIRLHMASEITGKERGLIGHWPFREGVGEQVFDVTPGKTHGTVTGASWWMSSECTGEVDVPPSTLMADMKKMFDSELGSDVTLVASDGRSLHAHKIILATRSDAFRAMLFGGMRESTQKEIAFPDMTFDVLSTLVQFLYTDNADINGDVVVGLFMAADQYQLTRLRALCENFILQNISLENVCTIFQTAHRLNAHKLRGFCFNWIINNFGDILTCESYTQLPSELQRDINHAAAYMHFSKRRRIDTDGQDESNSS